MGRVRVAWPICNLGQMSANGHGVRQDYVKAYEEVARP